MLRSFFIRLSKLNWAQRTKIRLGFARQMSRRFVAGESAADALAVAQTLNSQGIWVTLDHLGENTATSKDSEQASAEILSILGQAGSGGVKANVSVKLSQIGLLLDDALVKRNLKNILDCARSNQNFIRLDMEDSTCVDKTLDLYEWARESGYDNLGVVIQTYLFRSEKDILRLAKNSAKIRLCKGAYQEPPTVAFPLKKDVDDNYDHLVDLLLGEIKKTEMPQPAGGRIPPVLAVATHDQIRINHVTQALEQAGLPRQAVEFQMLYGIRRDLQAQLALKGYAVRVYVPYGTHWYPYFMRRLAERPANVWFMISNMFRK